MLYLCARGLQEDNNWIELRIVQLVYCRRGNVQNCVLILLNDFVDCREFDDALPAYEAIRKWVRGAINLLFDESKVAFESERAIS